MTNTKVIAEIANSHNGSVSEIIKTINCFSKIKYNELSFKFQIISADGLALKDYNFFNVYKELEIKETDWKKIINYTNKKGKIWLDIFDEYGLKILNQNKEKIFGIKLQSSVLTNNKILKRLDSLKHFNKKIIVNFSGYNLKQIKNLIDNNNFLNNNKNLILQYGFQSYPTKISDVNFNKLILIRGLFPKCEFSYADHTSYKEPFSKIIPIILNSNNIEYLEKHICFSRKKAKYDYESALEFNEFSEMIDNSNNLLIFKSTNKSTFQETKYLKSSIQKSILNRDVSIGTPVSIEDISFKRTSQKTTNIQNVNHYFNTNVIATKNLTKNKIIKLNNFKKPVIGIIIAGRLKSSRLKRKALLKINNKPSIQHCLESCTKVKNISKIILATSYLKEDKPLKKFNLNKKVNIFAGHPEDVIQRYLDSCKKFKIDIIVRVTADMPHISNEIVNFMLISHFENRSDYTYVNNAATGTGVEIYNTQTLKMIKKRKKDTKFSEYMTWYIMNNKEYFKINKVTLPKKLSRKYRLTLDYKEDLIMLNKLYSKMKKMKLKTNLENIFKVLDRFKDISKINKNCPLVFKTNKKLIESLNKQTKF